MFCKHHLNPQSTRGLKLREVNLSHSNNIQRQALIHSRSALALTTHQTASSGASRTRTVLQDLLCNENLWTGSWQAFQWPSLHRAGLKERLETLIMHGGLYYNTFWVMQPSAAPRSSFKQSLDTFFLLGGKAAALNLNGAPTVISLCFWKGQIEGNWEDNGSDGGPSTKQNRSTPKNGKADGADQGSAPSCWIWVPVFIKKYLLVYSHAPVFSYCLWLLYATMAQVSSCNRAYYVPRCWK